MGATRSRFVTVVAWVFGLFGLQTATNLMGITGNAVPDGMGFSSSLTAAIRGFAVVSGVIGVFVVASSIGLLLRKRWARRAFQCAIALEALGGLAIPFLLNAMFLHMEAGATPAKSDFPITTLLLSVVVLLATAWVAWRLESTAVKDEFAL